MDQNKKWCVYMHTNKINGKKYIGITSLNPPDRRWRNDGSGYHGGYLKNAINKYGWDNFEHIILKDGIESLDEANHYEQYYIKEYNFKSLLHELHRFINSFYIFQAQFNIL